MGTRFEVVLWGDEAPRLRACAEAALERIAELERRYSRFRPDSVLSFVNAHAGDRPVGIDADTFELLAACARAWLDSGGAFDPTISPLMRAWGFHGEPGDVQAAAACVGMDGVRLHDAARTVRFTRPGISLDLGGIAKGQALDEAAAIVREAGVSCGLLHGGTSTVVAIGSPPGEAGWVVEVRGSPYRVVLNDRAMSVSEPSGRVVVRDGRRLGHVLDPRNGTPVDGARLACVVGQSAMETDAWSTALLVLGARPSGMPRQLTTLLPQQGGAWAVEGPDERLFWRSEKAERAEQE